ncbi:MAG: hypothetical protein ACFFDU_03825 [Candidatus Thorarchaeota archaeon]
MSIHRASHIKCVACDSQATLEEARSQWWICTSCGSYICASCRALLLEAGEDICPGAIARGTEAHAPHFSRFLGPRREADNSDSNRGSKVVFLGDVRRKPQHTPEGRVIIFDDDEAQSEESTTSNGQEP